tara:strand:- start:3436 stop:5631 length:2196 start_codon:yes stop_codon:yes gene_type:complete
MAKKNSQKFNINNLNGVQKEAVEMIDKPVLIFAGAGTGKTRVLTHKIAYLIHKNHYEPENILALTFTNKAAKEMTERIEELIGQSSLRLNMGTFHSNCAKLLRYEIGLLGISENFVIYDTDDQKKFLKDIMGLLKIPKEEYSLNVIHRRISLLKNQMVLHNKAATDAKSPLDEIVAKVYPVYDKELKANNALDFDDLLLYPITIFKKYPKVLKKYQEKFKYVLVDEYQDTNKPQFQFVNYIAKGHKQICVVGDDDQSIYGWRGADVSNILKFEKAFPGCVTFKLEQNYRSTSTILSAAFSVVRNNAYRAEKKLWCESQNGEMIGVMETYDELEEAEGVLELLEKEIQMNKRGFRDYAILYRTNTQSRYFEDALRRRGIPYKIVGGIKFYSRKEVKDLLAYLRLIINPNDTVSLKRVINFPPRGIGIKTIDKCNSYGRKNHITMFEALLFPEKMDLKGKQAVGFHEFHQMINKYRDLLDKLSASEIASVLVDELGLVSYFKEEKTPEALERLENVHELLNSIEEFCKRNSSAGLKDFLEEVSLLTDLDEWEDRSNSVTLMTLHSSKGLEFPVVFIAGLEDGLFPIARCLDDPKELEEERRLFYVGLTRAKERAYLHYSTNRRKSSGIVGYGIASRFIHEIPGEFIERIKFESAVTRQLVREEKTGKYQLKQIRTVTAFDDFIRGDKVEHKLFGRGMVLTVDGTGENQKVTVMFRGNIRKKLIVKYAKMKKID